jgi:hypothetical protein
MAGEGGYLGGDCAFLIHAGGTLAAMDDLSGGKTHRVQVFRSSELTRNHVRGGRFCRHEVNVVRSDHHDDRSTFVTLERIGKVAQFRVHHPVRDGAGDKVGLTHKIGYEWSFRHVINALRCVELFEAALVEHGDAISHGKGFVVVVRDEDRCGFRAA